MSSYDDDALPAEACVPCREASLERVTINISAATPFTEIRVLNARYEPVALPSNAGSVDLTVPPGLYEVAFRNGTGDWETHHVVAAAGGGEAAAVAQALPEPVPSTARPDPTAGNGTVAVALSVDQADPRLAGALERIRITMLPAVGDSELQPIDVAGAPPGSRHYAAAPGYWRLRINEDHPRQPFELPIVVVPGYVAQVCGSVALVGEGPCVDLDRVRLRLLRESTVTMAPELLHYEEAALSALSSGRSLFGPDVVRLIEGLADDKALNPMLGILAAHLCDQRAEEHARFRRRLVDRLADLTGAPDVIHPDVAALRLALKLRDGQSIEDEPPIAFPPQLAASWRLLIDASEQHPELIPPGSWCERVADRLWSSSLWTAWTAPPLQDPTADSPRLAAEAVFEAAPTRAIAPRQAEEATRAIAELLGFPELRNWLRTASHPLEEASDGVAWDAVEQVTRAEAVVASAIVPLADDEQRQERMAKITSEHRRRLKGGPSVDPAAMATRLGLPAATVERAMSSLADKLEAMAMRLNIKL